MSQPDLKPVAERVALAPTPEEVKAILQADRVAREQRAMARIQQVLAEERCTMNPVMVLATGNISGRIEITAVD
jgi:ribosomal protein L18E